MDTVAAWLLPLAALLLFWAFLARRRAPGAPLQHRLLLAAIVVCAAAGAVLDAAL